MCVCVNECEREKDEPAKVSYVDKAKAPKQNRMQHKPIYSLRPKKA